ncbi:MAG: lamin tail domain-containing protein, partial [Clostridia bacterium]|nr:lamin tail domain-containing protein [Clostridia bacterium]
SDYATTLKPIVPLGYVFDHWTVNGEVHADPLLFVRATHAIDGEVEVKLFLKEDGKLRIKEISFVNGGDYIVLYNPGSAPVSTRGYSLSDDGNNLRKFTLPMMVVGAGEELVVYCDNYNTLEALRHQQTSFNLSKTETLYLTRSNDDATVRTVIDQIYLPDVHRGSIYVRQEYDKRFYEVLAEDLEQQ